MNIKLLAIGLLLSSTVSAHGYNHTYNYNYNYSYHNDNTMGYVAAGVAGVAILGQMLSPAPVYIQQPVVVPQYVPQPVYIQQPVYLRQELCSYRGQSVRVFDQYNNFIEWRTCY